GAHSPRRTAARPDRASPAGDGTCRPSSRPAPLPGLGRYPRTVASPPSRTALLPPPGRTAHTTAAGSGCAASAPAPPGGDRRRPDPSGSAARSPRTAAPKAPPDPSPPGTRHGVSPCGAVRNRRRAPSTGSSASASSRNIHPQVELRPRGKIRVSLGPMGLLVSGTPTLVGLFVFVFATILSIVLWTLIAKDHDSWLVLDDSEEGDD